MLMKSQWNISKELSKFYIQDLGPHAFLKINICITLVITTTLTNIYFQRYFKFETLSLQSKKFP
jgi:hypothetical protein